MMLMDIYRDTRSKLGPLQAPTIPSFSRGTPQADRDKAMAAYNQAMNRYNAVSGVQTIGEGGLSLSDIDKWLSDNPDAEYFRIGNVSQGKVGTGYFRSDKTGKGGDNFAAIVASDDDEQNSIIRRYASVGAAAQTATGKRGEKATIGINWTPSDFYKQSGIEFDQQDGLIVSRAEYGALKNQIKERDTSGFLNAPTKYPERRVDSPNVVDDMVATQRRKPASRQTILSGSPDGLGGGGVILGG